MTASPFPPGRPDRSCRLRQVVADLDGRYESGNRPARRRERPRGI